MQTPLRVCPDETQVQASDVQEVDRESSHNHSTIGTRELDILENPASLLDTLTSFIKDAVIEVVLYN